MLGLDGKEHTLTFDLDYTYRRSDLDSEIITAPTFQFDDIAYKLPRNDSNNDNEVELIEQFTTFASSCMVLLNNILIEN